MMNPEIPEMVIFSFHECTVVALPQLSVNKVITLYIQNCRKFNHVVTQRGKPRRWISLDARIFIGSLCIETAFCL